MLSAIYKLNDSVEVFLSPNQNREKHSSLIQFYRINTRESLYIESDEQTFHFLSLLDGKRSLSEIVKSYNFDMDGSIELVDFLLKNGLAFKIQNLIDCRNDRFVRQIAYFEDLLGVCNANKEQEKLKNKKIVIFGIGSVGSNMAILLARMGIKNFVFIDYKRVNKSHFVKHLYCDNTNIKQFKTDALKRYLLEIDNEISIEIFNEKILPQSDLAKFIPNNTDLIINTADEPYIGHISVKIGRYAWNIGVAFYVGGGFDAHSMSTGEMIIPHKTPCIDCYANSFKIALKDYKPKYINQCVKKTSQMSKRIQESSRIILGGPGSIGACNLFSASFGVMRMIYYLLNIKCNVSNRGEYLINQGIIRYSELEHTRRLDCKVCNG